MIIALPVEEDKGLDSHIYEHFGRAPIYILVHVKDNEIVKVESIENPYIYEHPRGIIPKLLADRKVDVVICRGIGFRARDVLSEYGIKVVTGAEGRVGDLVKAYINGSLKSVDYTPPERWRR